MPTAFLFYNAQSATEYLAQLEY